MAVLGVSQDEMRSALTELEQALYNHAHWCEELHTKLICGLAADQRDLDEDAHRKCRFGQWYYGAGAVRLRNFQGFAEIEAEHKNLHRFARVLLLASVQRRPISLDDYDRFGGALKRLRLEVETIKRDLEDGLRNLDPLTGAPSRVGMLAALRGQAAMVKRQLHHCCLVMLDVDHFKEVNDRYGHTVGDRVLIAISHHIMENLRPYDQFYRFGGEEFLACIVDADLQAGRKVVERLREDLALLPHQADDQGEFHVTVSCGLSLLDPDFTVEQSIDRADKALYVAKAAGRNRTAVWDAAIADGGDPTTALPEAASA